MDARSVRREEREARAEAAPVALAATLALVVLALLSRWRGWELLGESDWWLWLVLAAVTGLLAAVLLSGLGLGRGAAVRRRAAACLMAVVLSGSLAGLVVLLVSLIGQYGTPGAGQLLSTAVALLLVNTATFGIAYWELDCGGPIARAQSVRTVPDLQFPQDENPGLAREDWAPHVYDYLYVSLTNSIAFSPTDAMPLTHPAKGLMALQSLASAVTVLVVAARAVNVLGT